jgi:hypothetical protein
MIVGLFFAFLLSLCSGSTVQAQQENDDPNWRERKAERLKKEIEDLRKELEESQRKFEKMRLQFLNSRFPNSRFLNIYDYGPIPRNRGLI